MVRHGCPLAPYLFIICVDVLEYMINDPKYGVEGLRLPIDARSIEMLFADDTSLYLEGSKDNLARVHSVLDTVCAASGSTIS